LVVSYENAVSACQSCNSKKGSRNQAAFLGGQSTPPVFPDSSVPETVRVVPESPFVKPESIQVNAE
jgi:hypothetical protein